MDTLEKLLNILPHQIKKKEGFSKPVKAKGGTYPTEWKPTRIYDYPILTIYKTTDEPSYWIGYKIYGECVVMYNNEQLSTSGDIKDALEDMIELLKKVELI